MNHVAAFVLRLASASIDETIRMGLVPRFQMAVYGHAACVLDIAAHRYEAHP